MNNKIKQIGDKVLVLHDGKIRRAEIVDIQYSVIIEGAICGDMYDRTKVFDSKEELIESLSK